MTLRTTPSAPGAADHSRPDAGFRVLPYHRLGHADPGHRWWKPLVELVIFGAVYLVLAVALVVLWVVGVLVVRGEDALQEMFQDPSRIEVMDPAWLFLVLASVIIMVPAVLLGRVPMGPRPMGLLLSVTGRVRWAFLGRTLLLGAAVYAVGHGVLLLLEYALTGAVPPVRPVEGFWLVVLMIVLLVPIQCAAEELVFRGVLSQAVGRWLRHPAFAILLPAPVFALGHLYNAWGSLAVTFMAVVAGWLTWRTGGLEAAIALHVVNNVLAFSFGALGWVEPAEQEATWVSLVTVVPLYLVFAWLVVRSARKHRVAVTRTVHLPPVAGPGPGGPMPPPTPWAPAPGASAPGTPALGGPVGWVCPGPPACPGHWAGRPPVPQRLP